ncbi:putative disease resistance protein [Nymphaea thermarum]|nr:putative disease resistance protein [Nymphaea thermarum]
MKGRKYLLILDDVWQGFNIHVLGIPDPVNGSKVVLISGTLGACDAMQTGRNIMVEATCWKDAMSLFLHNTGDLIKQPTIEKIAMGVLRDCGGLRTAIATIGAALMNNDDVRVWEDTLKALKQSTVHRRHRRLKFQALYMDSLKGLIQMECSCARCCVKLQGIDGCSDEPPLWMDLEGWVGCYNKRRKENDKLHLATAKEEEGCMEAMYALEILLLSQQGPSTTADMEWLVRATKPVVRSCRLGEEQEEGYANAKGPIDCRQSCSLKHGTV